MKKILFIYTIIQFGLFNFQLFSQSGVDCASAIKLDKPGTFTTTPPTSWYKFIPDTTGILSINSCGNSGSIDTYIRVFEGICGNLDTIAQNDDNNDEYCSQVGLSYIDEVVLLKGKTYFFEWDNSFVTSNFKWSFTFNPLPKNFDAGVSEIINRYSIIPLNQITDGLKLGGVVKNLSGNNITNLILKAEIYELSDTLTPIHTFPSAPVNLSAGEKMEIVCKVWTPSNLSTSKSYIIKYIKYQNEMDQVSFNDTLIQKLALDFNYMARDDNNFAKTMDLPTASSISQGSKFSFLKNDSITAVDYFVGPFSSPQSYRVQVWPVKNNLVSLTPIYSSDTLKTVNLGWNTYKLDSSIAVSPGEYMIVITNTGTKSFPLGCSKQIFTKKTSYYREGTKLWLPIDKRDDITFMIRPKLGPDPAKDIKFISNINPGGEYTQIHCCQATNGNDLVFSAKAKNVGTKEIQTELIVTLKNSQGITIYSDTSSKQDLNPGDTVTFTVDDFLVTEYDDYTINYNFFAVDEQVPQNNVHTTGFSRTKNRMSRSYGNTGSFGIGDNQTPGVYDNGIIGQTFKLDYKDYLDSVEIVLNQNTPSKQSVSVQIFKTNAEGIPTGVPIGTTTSYITTNKDSISGVTLKLPIIGGSYLLDPGTYFFGVNENAGDIRLATSVYYHSPKKAFVKWDQNPSGSDIWTPIEELNQFVSLVINPVFQICIPDPTKDIKFISNINPGGEYTQIHSRQSTNGNDLVFSAKAKNTGKEIVETELIVEVKNSQGVTIYTDTSSKQKLNPGDIGAFTVPNFLVTEYDDYTINYNFFAVDDQVPQNNIHTTGFSRTKNRMSRSYGNTGSFGIGDNQTPGVYDNGIIGQTFKLDYKDYLDSVEIVLNQNTPSKQSVSVQIFKTNAEGIPTGVPIGTTTSYITTNKDSISGVTLKLPIIGGSYLLDPGTYFFGVNENAGDIRLATSVYYHSPKKAFVKWDQNPSGSDIWTPIEELNQFVSFVINPVFETCVPINIVKSVIDESDGKDGAINLTVSGGVAPYSFIWSNNLISEDISGLSGGIYIVTISDANDCSYSDSILVSSNSLKVYPNPGYDIINVQTSKDREILFFDLNGKITYSKFIVAGNNSIDVSSFKGGVYLIRLDEEVIKWIKQ